jgi:hypothetical protein
MMGVVDALSNQDGIVASEVLKRRFAKFNPPWKRADANLPKM